MLISSGIKAERTKIRRTPQDVASEVCRSMQSALIGNTPDEGMSWLIEAGIGRTGAVGASRRTISAKGRYCCRAMIKHALGGFPGKPFRPTGLI